MQKMMSQNESLASLIAALQDGREKPVPARAWAGVADRFLAPGEKALLALEGNGFTWWDPLLLLTDRRVMQLRRGIISSWRKIREVSAADVLGAEFRKRALWWGPVIVRTRSGNDLRIRSNQDEVAQRFADGVNRLVSGGMR